MKVRTGKARLAEKMLPVPTELPPRRSWGQRLLRLDQLVRNLVVTGALLLLVVAVRNTTGPEAQSVFGAIQQSAQMEWDESVGKLTFVNALWPQSVRAVWQEEEAYTVFAPVHGSVVHAWSHAEPYLMIQSPLLDVRAAADGEIMSIAHGLDEERIVRIRHDDGAESLYGNLETCYAQEGDRVYAGDVFASLRNDEPLAFEWRVDGRSVNPENRMLPIPE